MSGHDRSGFISSHAIDQKQGALLLAPALLEYPVDGNNTRLLKQTPVLDKSGHDYGKFNDVKCNRIPTQRSIQKLFKSNWEKWGDKKSATSHTSVAKTPPTREQAKLACKLEGKNIPITIVTPPMKGKNDDNETAARIWTITLNVD